ncbi:hypothetical protein THASP1DRAFT_26310, partial [Thamnocephalis sphaerospora]
MVLNGERQSVGEEEREAIYQLVQRATTSGEREPNAAFVKRFKAFCRRSTAHVEAAYETLYTKMQTKHAQHARKLVHTDLPDWVRLAVGVHGEKLPPPQAYANSLRQLMLESIRAWYDRHGDRHRQADEHEIGAQIKLAYDFLRHNNGVDFSNLSRATARLGHRNEEGADERQERIRRNARLKRFEAIHNEIEQGRAAIMENILDMNNCMNILVPQLFDDTGENDSADEKKELANEESKATFRQIAHNHGLGSARYTLTINLGDADHADVQETAENRVIYDELRAGRRLIMTRHLARVSQWLDYLGQSESEEPGRRDTVIKQCLDMKEQMQNLLDKCDELGVVDERDEDEQFEVVPVHAGDVVAGDNGGSSSSRAVSSVNGCATTDRLRRSAANKESKPTQNRYAPLPRRIRGEQAPLLATAPVVEYGDDIHYWNEKEIPINSSGLAAPTAKTM